MGVSTESTPWYQPETWISLVRTLILTIASFIAAMFLLSRIFMATHSAQEPPIIQSRVPLIGHLISMIKYRASFIKALYDKSGKRLSIASVPILNGKLYAICDPVLTQSVFANKHLEFTPFIVEFAQQEVNYGKDVDRILRETPLITDMLVGIRDAMNPQNTNHMSRNALHYLAKRLEKVSPGGEWTTVPNVYLWTRDILTLATSNALYGPHDPLQQDESLCDDLWCFEKDLPMFLLKLFPSVLARSAWKARERVQTALGKYYAAEHDAHEEAAALVRNRAMALRKNGVIGEATGRFELTLLHVATSNTIPTIFWMLAYIFTDPNLVTRLEKEVNSVAQVEPDQIIFDMDNLTTTCPLLVSSYREVIRLCNKTIGNRRATADTTIRDDKGRSYLLKKGVNVQTSGEVLHNSEDAWGPDVASFDPERFLPSNTEQGSADAKLRRISYTPFGGGKHLCPGRNFAFAESLGLVMTLLQMYDVAPPGGDWESWEPPVQDECSLAAAVCKPVSEGAGFGMRIKRKDGFDEKVINYRIGGIVKNRV